MKPLLTFVTTLLIVITSTAAPQSCKELNASYKADLITPFDDECEAGACLSLQLLQLRRVLQLKDPAYDPSMSDEAMLKKYGPGFSKLKVGNEFFDGVAICLDECTRYFFSGGTINMSTLKLVESEEDKYDVLLNDVVCSAELTPYNSKERREKLCKMAVNRFKVIEPEMKIDMATCLDRDSKFGFLTEGGNADQVQFAVIHMNNEKFFICNADLVRKTNELKNLECSTEF